MLQENDGEAGRQSREGPTAIPQGSEKKILVTQFSDQFTVHHAAACYCCLMLGFSRYSMIETSATKLREKESLSTILSNCYNTTMEVCPLKPNILHITSSEFQEHVKELCFMMFE